MPNEAKPGVGTGPGDEDRAGRDPGEIFRAVLLGTVPVVLALAFVLAVPAGAVDAAKRPGPGNVDDGNGTENASDVPALLTGGGEVVPITADRLADKRPSVAAIDGGYLAVWSHQMGEKSVQAGRDVYMSLYTGDRWTAPAPVTDNYRFDMYPDVAYDEDSGRALAAWVQVPKDLRGEENLTPRDYFNDSEIVYATYDGSSWSEPRRITRDSRLDVLPKVLEKDGRFRVVWRSPRGSPESAEVRYATVEGGSAGPVRSRSFPNADYFAYSAGEDHPFKLAYYESSGGGTGSIVVLGGDDSYEELARYDAEKPGSVGLGESAVAWVDEDRGSEARIRYASDGTVTTLPRNLRSSSTINLQVHSVGEDTLVTYRAVPENVSTGRLMYALRRDGEWIWEHQINSTGSERLAFAGTDVATRREDFAAVFTGRERDKVNQNQDVFGTVHRYRPDLRPEVTGYSPTDASVGESVTINYTVRNVGDVLLNGTFSVGIDNRVGPALTQPFAGLGVGATVNRTATVRVPDSGRVTVVADPADGYPEVSETNNDVTVSVASPNVSVTNATAVRSGGSLEVVANVTNVGGALAPEVTVLFVNRNDTLASRTLSDLRPDETRRVRLNTSAEDLRSASGLLVRAVTPRDRRGIDNAATVALFGPEVGIFGSEVSFSRRGNSVVAEVYVENTGFSPAVVDLVARTPDGEVINGTRLRIDGVPTNRSYTTTTATVVLPASVEGQRIDLFAEVERERDASDNAVRVRVPNLSAVDDRPPSVESFSATASGSTVEVRVDADEPLKRSRIGVRISGPTSTQVVGRQFEPTGDGTVYVANVTLDRPGTYDLTLVALADTAGNEPSELDVSTSVTVQRGGGSDGPGGGNRSDGNASADSGTGNGGGGLPLVALLVVALLAAVGVGAGAYYLREDGFRIRGDDSE